ncbi:hypothetical protein EIN_031370 [Entamoeba invadens IP1]|uniref:Uncharacterized protein n=1 Tax=Entamoeba invadens IP1 TaxID=370355 RepID=A0A0A1U412_ENTIV|nr:hypothetical protein EIN_031370 [Entamoeba invadens IP1]ELP86426.1 hypothetical protein EIN_031370 [Entamoeba invadens IP1]|eukprot:XP_004185772.1 hypothetical protein EIN_031370 [Entamoeba invadens IP1]
MSVVEEVEGVVSLVTREVSEFVESYTSYKQTILESLNQNTKEIVEMVVTPKEMKTFHIDETIQQITHTENYNKELIKNHQQIEILVQRISCDVSTIFTLIFSDNKKYFIPKCVAKKLLDNVEGFEDELEEVQLDIESVGFNFVLKKLRGENFEVPVNLKKQTKTIFDFFEIQL